MSILTGPEIKREWSNHNIIIVPWEEDLLSCNSYDLRLGSTLKVLTPESFWEWCKWMVWGPTLDTRKDLKWREIIIPESGYWLKPRTHYLGHTIEQAGSNKYIPDVSGKSRTGRYGLSVHNTAGWGDTGFGGDRSRRETWTLEISCLAWTKVYPGMKIAQVRFTEPHGEVELYNGNYVNQVGPTGPQYKGV